MLISNFRKSILILMIAVLPSLMFAQDDPCIQRINNQPGSWGKISRSERANPTELAIQKKFVNAVNAALESDYNPKSLQAERSVWHINREAGVPVAPYGITLYGLQYSCDGDKLTLNHETSTSMRVNFNQFEDAPLYDTASDYTLTGYHRISRGLPLEIRPGIWQFPDGPASLGFGMTGTSKAWLITYDGKLPWSFVTRREFLIKRKRNLERLMAEETPRFKERILQWETQKKFKEQESKDDPAKLKRFIDVDYNPAIERENANYKKSVEAWTKAIERVDEQLTAPATDLDKIAIVVNSSRNFRDYDFADKVVPFAEILVKPNPAYFNRSLPASVPQMIKAEIIFNHQEPVATRFAQDMEAVINLDYLKSFIGKTAPGSIPPKGNTTGRGAASSTPVAEPNKTTPGTASATSSSLVSAVAVSSTASTNSINNGTTGGSSNAKKYSVSGFLSAPTGVPVSLSCNGGKDLTITPPRTDGSLYNTVLVTLPDQITYGASYTVTLKKTASNMKGVVYRGSGSVPADIDKIRIGVDFIYELVTRSTDDKVMSTFYESAAPVIGGYNGNEGRYVTFVSHTQGLQGASGKFRQIFWRDRNTGVTKLISVSPTGEQANGDCHEPSISADGLTVAFESKANNLVSGDKNNVKDIFVWKASTNTVELVSVSSNGALSDGESFDAMIAGNGEYVAFTSLATNLSSLPKGRSNANVFVRELKSKNTEMLSVDPKLHSGGDGHKASISFDGSRVTFCSASNTLVSNDNNGLWDIFLWQRGSSVLRRISLTHDGKERNAGSESASRQVSSSISGDGKHVVFATTASNMVPNDNNNFQDVFVVEIETGKVMVASFTDDGQPSNGDSPIEQGERIAITYDGAWVAFPTRASNLGADPSNIILHNTVTNKKQSASNVKGSYVGRPSISYSGSYVAFGKATNLDGRFSASGIFAYFTGNGKCRKCE